MIKFAAHILLLASLLGAFVQRAVAEGPETQCLSAVAVQEAVSGGKVMRLADIKRKLAGDIVRAELCRNQGRLAYEMTVLTLEGKVRRLTYDAKSGEAIPQQK